MRFRIIGRIEDTEAIAIGRSIRSLKELQRRFGRGRWRKMKGVATVEFNAGAVRRAV